MDVIDKMAEQFKDLAEVQAYAASLYQTIVKLSQQINQKNEEIEHLKKLIADNTPILSPEGNGSIFVLKDLTDQEAIAVNELRKLKDVSLLSPLTLEECKKYDVYVKVLAGMKRKEPGKEEVKDHSTDNLLHLVKD